MLYIAMDHRIVVFDTAAANATSPPKVVLEKTIFPHRTSEYSPEGLVVIDKQVSALYVMECVSCAEAPFISVPQKRALGSLELLENTTVADQLAPGAYDPASGLLHLSGFDSLYTFDVHSWKVAGRFPQTLIKHDFINGVALDHARKYLYYATGWELVQVDRASMKVTRRFEDLSKLFPGTYEGNLGRESPRIESGTEPLLA
jgi:hypothetical protein